MLSLQLKDGEYLTIGKDIVVQVFAGCTARVSVQAPKDVTILRGEVWERNGEPRPKCVSDARQKRAPRPVYDYEGVFIAPSDGDSL